MTTRGVILIAVVSTLRCTSGPEPAFQRLADETSTLMLPPGGVLLQRPIVTREPLGMRAAWRIRVPRSWKDYRAWLVEQLGREYRVTEESDTRMVCAKSADADTFTLTAELSIAKEEQIEVALSLRGAPN